MQHEGRKTRAKLLSQQFTNEQLSGARWNLPGWAEANRAFDEADVGRMSVMKPVETPKTPSQG